MLRRGNPYVFLVAGLVLVFVSVSAGHPGLTVLFGVLGIAASAVAVLLFVRQARDPNGPPGQH